MAIVFVRVIVLYLLIIIAMRVLGKRQIGQLEPGELVLALIIADIAAVPMQDMGIPLLFGILPIIILVSVSLLISGLSVKNIRFRTFVSGKSSIVIERGEIVQSEMKKNRITVDELFEELRLQGVLDISQVKYGILETNGRMSVILWPSEKPPSAAMMNMEAKGGDLQTIIINAGRVLDKNLQLIGRSRSWLENELKSRKIASPDEVYLMTLDTGGRVYISMRQPLINKK
ncbi:MAG: DUF421 domain-containing protein [Oscillospiraceae bacterium]